MIETSPVELKLSPNPEDRRNRKPEDLKNDQRTNNAKKYKA